MTLQRTNTSTDIKFTYVWMLGREVDEGVDSEIIVCTGAFAFIDMVEVISVCETEVKIGYVFVKVCACLWVNRPYVIDVAVAYTYLEGRAIFSKTVLPFTRQAHIKRFCVAPTLGKLKIIFAGVSLRAFKIIFPPSRCTFAPSFVKPFK